MSRDVAAVGRELAVHGQFAGQRTGAHAADGLVVMGTLRLQHRLRERPGQLHRVSSYTVKMSVYPRIFVASLPYFNGTGSV